MNDGLTKPAIRVIRQKEVADIARDVLQGKEDLPQLEASLHRIKSRYNKVQYVEREVLDAVLESQLLLARTVRRLAAEVEELRRPQVVRI